MSQKHIKLLLSFSFIILVHLLLNAGPAAQLQAAAVTFTGGELLGKPTDTIHAGYEGLGGRFA